ncbi:MAG TPA: 50S ribosomal protein L15 [Patescibacteria group bacterium]|nr:50S ribosomal protein L15 [Patescibacteria group bacterium]
MQLHQLKPTNKKISGKRVGRGGKRGAYSGRGSKGQKSRAGTRIRPGFRGGNEPIWKVFPKRRGASKKIALRSGLFQVHYGRLATVNLGVLDRYFKDGDRVDGNILVKKGLVKTAKFGVKILGTGELTKHLVFDEKLSFSQSARDKIK